MKINQLLILFLGLIFNTNILAQITSTNSGGEWTSGSSWIGGQVPTKTDDVVINGPINITNGSYSSTKGSCKNLTINAGASITGNAWIEVQGNFTNNGSINNYITEVHGNIQNNGIFSGAELKVLGKAPTIGATNRFECNKVFLSTKDKLITATSDLEFHNTEIWSYGSTRNTIDMSSNKLTCSSDSIVYDSYYKTFGTAGKLRSISIKYTETGHLTLNTATIYDVLVNGNLIIDGDFALFSGARSSKSLINGNLEFNKSTNISASSWDTGLGINGDLINYTGIGTDSSYCGDKYVSHHPIGIEVHGNVMNYGSTSGGSITIYADDKERLISGEFGSQINVLYNEENTKSSGKIIVQNNLLAKYNGNGQITVKCPMEIKPTGKLETTWIYGPISIWNNGTSSWGEIINNGTITVLHSAKINSTFEGKSSTYATIDFRGVEEGFDSLRVSCFNNQTHSGIEGSIKRWWKIESLNDKTVKNYTLTLRYKDELLNGQDENHLQLYNSQNNGETWELVSYSDIIGRDTENNSITIGNWINPSQQLTMLGDFILSSGDGIFSVEPEIKTNIVGRENLRMGAPNQFTLHYENVSNEETSDFLLAIAIAEDTRIDEVTLYRNGKPETFTPDQFWTGLEDDSLTIAFYVPFMAPWEVSKIDLTVTGIPQGSGSGSMLKTTSPDAVLTTIAMTAIGYGIGKGISYLADKFKKNVELSESELQTYSKGMGTTAEKVRVKKHKSGYTEFWTKTILDNGVDNMLNLTPGVGLAKGTIDAMAENAAKVAPSLRQRIWFWLYKETGLYDSEDVGGKTYNPKVISGSSKEGERVTSWDPNEKIGPSGFGEQNHLASVKKMNYKILFENKKEATAAAYRVVIRDTLSEVFDPETVEFGAVSHVGDQYNWEITRDGNILVWDIKGIELPPNVNAPEGEGWVSFSVSPKSALPSGSEFKNKATIVFDMNDPIITNEVINILDFEVPETEMKILPVISENEKLKVEWNCDDKTNGSGIESTILYVSVNDGPFTELLKTSNKFAMVNVINGNDYKFYALSKDNVGNKEIQIPEIVSTSILTSVETNEIPNTFYLKQNYPNPFNPETKIVFEIPKESKIKIIVYDVLGQIVDILTDNIYPSGKHFVNWNAEIFASGVYFYKIISNSIEGNVYYQDIKKMLLIK